MLSFAPSLIPFRKDLMILLKSSPTIFLRGIPNQSPVSTLRMSFAARFMRRRLPFTSVVIIPVATFSRMTSMYFLFSSISSFAIFSSLAILLKALTRVPISSLPLSSRLISNLPFAMMAAPSFTLSSGTAISVAILIPIHMEKNMLRMVIRKRGIIKLYFKIFLSGLASLNSVWIFVICFMLWVPFTLIFSPRKRRPFSCPVSSVSGVRNTRSSPSFRGANCLACLFLRNDFDFSARISFICSVRAPDALTGFPATSRTARYPRKFDFPSFLMKAASSLSFSSMPLSRIVAAS
ncbi:MAG: hypothetical protein A4E57_03712 [Syntrophorhabdaceae bacterium PtaU1.Bin034]|nr:MAG: hypothetical protein A4E57_03712 [Syntrophorhabdaceae bacterium PtaU1.Bin034]